MTTNRRAMLLGLAAVICWSTAASAFKISLTHMSPHMLLLWSSVVSLVVLLARSILAREWRELLRAGGLNLPFLGRAAVRGLLNPFLYYLVLFEAYDRLPAQIAMVINYLWPVALVLLSAPLLGQRLSPAKMGAVVAGFAGVAVLALGNSGSADGGADLFAMGLALASTVIWALFWILNMRHAGRDSIKMASGFGFAVIYLLAYGLLRGYDPIALPGAPGIFGCVWVGLFEMGITFLLWLRALSLADSTARVGSLIYLTPFLSLLWIAVSVGERITVATIGGLVLIVGGIAAGALTARPREGSDQVQ